MLQDIKRADYIVAHNSKFELGWLRRCGLDLRSVPPVWDTMLAEWVLAGNLRPGFSLAQSLIRRSIRPKVSDVEHLIHTAGICPSNIPRPWLLEYCKQDVDATEQLLREQLRLVAQRDQLHLVYQRGLVAACLADIEPQGLQLDKERVYTEYEKVLAEYRETEAKLEAYGTINWRSGKQVAELLYDTLGFKEPSDFRGNPRRSVAGRRKTDKATVSSLSARTKQQREFKELFTKVAHLSAKLTKTLDFFKGVCDEYDGVFYGSLNQGTTGTHRLSSSGRKLHFRSTDAASGVQLQNLPREYKSLFCARRAGYLVLDVDASQLEFRVAADLGHDELAQAEIAAGVDIHSITAKTLTDAGEATDRQSAKSRTFRPLYGGRTGTKAEQEYCKFFQRKYAGIFRTQTSWTIEVVNTGELKTPYGLRYYWPGTKCSQTGYIDNTTSIFNYPIQGFATGEIVPLSLLWFWYKTKDLRVFIVNTIHDSVIAEVHPEDLDEAKKIATECFTTDVYNSLRNLYKYDFTTQLKAEAKAGKHWGDKD